MVSFVVYGTILLFAFIVMDHCDGFYTLPLTKSWPKRLPLYVESLDISGLPLYVESLDISVLKKFNLKNLSCFYIYTQLRDSLG